MLLNVKNLKKYYKIKASKSAKQQFIRAVDNVSFTIERSKTLGLVGESGSGKTTTGKLILRLIEPTSGKILFNDEEIMQMTKKEMQIKRNDMQIIFQDPYSSLNPKMTVGSIIGEAFEIHRNMNKIERREASLELLNKVGLSSNHLNHYPHEFSGGQRQRICIARAIALKPQFIVCDEAVSSLDVSIRSQIIELLEQLQQDYNIAYLFIAHDLSAVQRLSDHVAIMFKGKIVETAKTNEFYMNHLHPYTTSLFSAIPIPDPCVKRNRKFTVYEDINLEAEPEKGCDYQNRCEHVFERCKEIIPQLTEIGAEHFVSCHRFE